ncbi:MAG: hypothetical protein ACLSUT_04510 [Christensenellales bacterium]
MVFEKKLIILTGDGGVKGTLRLERNAYGLRGVLNAYNLPKKASGDYVLAVKTGDVLKEYPLGYKPAGGRSVELDSGTDVAESHFVVYEKGGPALLYGTLSRHRLWRGNLPDGIKREESGEKIAYNAGKSDKKAAEAFEFSKREDLFLDIFPSGGEYADNAVAAVNYYDKAFSERAADLGDEEKESDSGASVSAPEYNEHGIRVEYIREHEKESVRDVNNTSISDLQRDYIKKYATALSSRRAETSAAPRNKRRPISDLQTEYIRSFTGAKRMRERTLGGVSALADKMESAFEGASVLVPKLSEDGEEHVRGRRLSYYEQVADQIEKLFSEGSRDAELEALMPYTKWVKIDYAGDGRHYVVGLIGEKPDYVCYGLPGVYSPEAPEELKGYCGWLPLDVKNPHGSGYWLLYQDAETGESVPEAERI